MSEKRDKMREAIKVADDIRHRIVIVPEWDKMEVEVRGLNTYERTSVFENAKTGVVDADGEARIDSRRLLPAIIIATAHVPETGEALFGPEDEDWLNGKSAMATGMLFAAATELSGISKAEVDRIKKDSDPTPKPVST